MTATAVVLLAAACVAAVALGRSAWRAASGGRPSEHAPARASAARGVVYAFTTAFAPWAKESARHYLPTYLAGIVYHTAAFATLAWTVASTVPPAANAVAAAGRPLAALAAVGLACGLGLLAKRLAAPRLRALSVPDDFVANLLLDAALAAAVAAGLQPTALPVAQLTVAAVLLYLPLGKLRHMVFLPLARRHWGRNLGRRGVLPPPPLPGGGR